MRGGFKGYKRNIAAEFGQKKSANDLIQDELYRRDRAKMLTGRMSKEEFAAKWGKYKKGKQKIAK